MTPRGDLTVRRPRRTRWLEGLLVLAVLAAAGAWFVTHPRPLPTPDAQVTGATPVDVPIFVRVYSAALDGERTLTVRDVEVDTSGDVDVEVRPWVCRDGSPVVTTDPEQLCSTLDEWQGADLGPTDSLLIELAAEGPGIVSVDEVEVAYRDDLQWATKPVGPPIEVEFLER